MYCLTFFSFESVSKLDSQRSIYITHCLTVSPNIFWKIGQFWAVVNVSSYNWTTEDKLLMSVGSYWTFFSTVTDSTWRVTLNYYRD